MVMHKENGDCVVTHCKQEDTIDQLVNRQAKQDELLKKLNDEMLVKLTSNSVKLDALADKMNDLKKVFDTMDTCLNALTVTQATGPTKSEMDVIKEELVRHKTWFQIIGAAVGVMATAMVGLVILIVDHII